MGPSGPLSGKGFSATWRVGAMTNQKTKATRCSVETAPCHPDRQWKGWDLSLGLPGFRAHGLAHCSVTSTAEHIARTGMGVMDSGMGASKLGLSWGCSLEVSGCGGDRVQGPQVGVPIAEITGMVSAESLLGKICMGRRPIYSGPSLGALLNAELWSQPVITFMCLFFMFSLL